MTQRTIVVIGGGFAGAMTAAHLLRAAGDEPLRVVLVNRTGWLARGVAYGTRTEQHVLNVPAGRMSAYADDEEHFLRFARRAMPGVEGGTFVPRRLYGDYLEWVVTEAAAAARPSVAFEHRVDHALDVEVPADGGPVRVGLATGENLRADRVVLALGNFAPAHPRVADRSFYARSRRYVRDPWRPGALDAIAPDAPVLLIGSGLTMLDVVLDLRAAGHRGRVYSVSRRGLLPQGHREHTAPPTREHLPPDLLDGPATTRAYVRSVRAHVRRLAERGVDWREVVGALRPVTAALWQALPQAERARFLRHVAVYWDVHRHRAAPELSAGLDGMVERGELELVAGRVQAFRDMGDGVQVRLHCRGQAADTTLDVGWVINCTGPSSNTRTLEEPLLQSLHARGLLRPDPLGIGIVVGEDYAVHSAADQPSPVLYYVGPFLKARYWEATAVPELRVHAARVAERVLRSLEPHAAAAAA